MSFTCSVCLELLSNAADTDNSARQMSRSNNQDILATRCGHLYHSVCLEDWLNAPGNGGGSCPTCRTATVIQQCLKIYLPTTGDSESGAGHSKLSQMKNEITKLQEDLKLARCDIEKERSVQSSLRFELNSKSSELDSVKFMLIERKRELRSAETYLADKLKQLKTDNSILESKLSDLEQKLLTKQQQWQQRMQEQEERCTSLEKELGECGMKLIKKQEELEESKRATSAESENIIESLTMSRDMLRKELRNLQLKDLAEARPDRIFIASSTKAV